MRKCYGVDIGNSGLRIAELDLSSALPPKSDSMHLSFRLNWESLGSATPADPPRYAPHDPAWLAELDRYLQAPDVGTSDPRSALWLISSVRRDAAELLRGHLQREAATEIVTVTREQLPLKVAVRFPDRVGIDRLLAAYAASELTSHRPLIVIQAGSAVTVDLVNGASGTRATFEGGAILPGIPMMLKLLGQAADLLPEVRADELVDLPALPGKDTEQAMLCGAASGLIGGIQHLVARYRRKFGQTVPVILSGGDGLRVSPHVPQPFQVEPHLVHQGLLLLARHLASPINP